jgi:hypothetical protein
LRVCSTLVTSIWQFSSSPQHKHDAELQLWAKQALLRLSINDANKTRIAALQKKSLSQVLSLLPLLVQTRIAALQKKSLSQVLSLLALLVQTRIAA